MVTDQKPVAAGNSVTSEVQWTGHSLAHPLEQLVGRAVLPVLALEEQLVLDAALALVTLSSVGSLTLSA